MSGMARTSRGTLNIRQSFCIICYIINVHIELYAQGIQSPNCFDNKCEPRHYGHKTQMQNFLIFPTGFLHKMWREFCIWVNVKTHMAMTM